MPPTSLRANRLLGLKCAGRGQVAVFVAVCVRFLSTGGGLEHWMCKGDAPYNGGGELGAECVSERLRSPMIFRIFC